MFKLSINHLFSVLTGILLISINCANAQISDSDGDGINDLSDFCQGTESGLQVNSFGCPSMLVECDFNTDNFSVVSQTAPLGVVTKYVLAKGSDGEILQVNDLPTFSNLLGSKTYTVLSYSYEDNSTLVNLLPGRLISEVSSSCGDWSNGLPVKVCSPFVDNTNCDFTSSTISLSATTAPTSGTTKYILVDETNTIVKLADVATFSGITGFNTFNAYAISYDGIINNLELGSNISDVNGDCLDFSFPLSLKVCVCSINCLPVTLLKLK